MDPPKWLPLPCAVCGRKTVRKLLTLENPLEYDLTVLQNPCLPSYVEPTTCNFAAYDRAILCPAALKNRDQKGPMDMCGDCKRVLELHLQPLDSMANFQYYVRDELGPRIIGGKARSRKSQIWGFLSGQFMVRVGIFCPDRT
jgi:hypothetical protein